MTDYHRQQVSQADMGRPRVSFSQFIIYHILYFSFQDIETSTGWRSGTPGKRVRRRYSESEEYDSDSDTDRNESSRTESSNQLIKKDFTHSDIGHSSIFKLSKQKMVQQVYISLNPFCRLLSDLL